MVALGEELHGLRGSEWRAQQPLSVRVLAQLPEDAGVGRLDGRKAGLVLCLFAGRLVFPVHGHGFFGVNDDVVEAVVAVEVLRDVVAVAVHFEFSVEWIEDSGEVWRQCVLLCSHTLPL